MKRNFIIKSAATVLVVTIAVACVVSRTFARYSTVNSGTASVNVAKWSFNVNSTDIAKSKSFNFKPFDSVVPEDKTVADSHLSSNNLIAPGTGGTFTINLKNTSSVSAKCDVSFAVNNASGIPVEFSIDGNNYAAAPTTYNSGTMAKNSSKEVTLYWRWSADGNSTKDSTLQSSQASLSVTATAKAYQAD